VVLEIDRDLLRAVFLANVTADEGMLVVEEDLPLMLFMLFILYCFLLSLQYSAGRSSSAVRKNGKGFKT
jgi:hypothetical protein